MFKNAVFWVVTQKTAFFIVTAVKTSNLTNMFKFHNLGWNTRFLD
jgi:hypothetical protein